MHVAVVTQPCLQPKLKPEENGYALKGKFNVISCFVGMFLHSFKNAKYFSLPFCFNSESSYKNENWYHY